MIVFIREMNLGGLEGAKRLGSFVMVFPFFSQHPNSGPPSPPKLDVPWPKRKSIDLLVSFRPFMALCTGCVILCVCVCLYFRYSLSYLLPRVLCVALVFGKKGGGVSSLWSGRLEHWPSARPIRLGCLFPDFFVFSEHWLLQIWRWTSRLKGFQTKLWLY